MLQVNVYRVVQKNGTPVLFLPVKKMVKIGAHLRKLSQN